MTEKNRKGSNTTAKFSDDSSKIATLQRHVLVNGNRMQIEIFAPR